MPEEGAVVLENGDCRTLTLSTQVGNLSIHPEDLGLLQRLKDVEKAQEQQRQDFEVSQVALGRQRQHLNAHI